MRYDQRDLLEEAQDWSDNADDSSNSSHSKSAGSVFEPNVENYAFKMQNAPAFPRHSNAAMMRALGGGGTGDPRESTFKISTNKKPHKKFSGSNFTGFTNSKIETNKDDNENNEQEEVDPNSLLTDSPLGLRG